MRISIFSFALVVLIVSIFASTSEAASFAIKEKEWRDREPVLDPKSQPRRLPTGMVTAAILALNKENNPRPPLELCSSADDIQKYIQENFKVRADINTRMMLENAVKEGRLEVAAKDGTFCLKGGLSQPKGREVDPTRMVLEAIRALNGNQITATREAILDHILDKQLVMDDTKKISQMLDDKAGATGCYDRAMMIDKRMLDGALQRAVQDDLLKESEGSFQVTLRGRDYFTRQKISKKRDRFSAGGKVLEFRRKTEMN